MSFSAAATGFVALFLSMTVGQVEPDWSVKYDPSQICALTGSTVKIKCSYTYPYKIHGITTKVKTRLWFTKGNNQVPVDLKKDSDYNGRIIYNFTDNSCNLTIKDLNLRDSAEYKFRFVTNQPDGAFTGLPGVILTVTDLRVQVRRSEMQTELKCESSCDPIKPPSYVWFNKEKKMEEQTSSILVSVRDGDRFSCSVKGHEDLRSRPVYAPTFTSANLMTSGQITEGRSVTLSCSSDANPEANYTWRKKNNQSIVSEDQQFVFWSILSSDSGLYYCTAQNQLGEETSGPVSVQVTYGPRPPSVSVTPSGEIMEGSLVTLSCSSDANPEANYTWYKEGEEAPKASGQNFTITNIMFKQRGNYYCEAQNSRGRCNSTVTVNVVLAPRNQVAAAAAVPAVFLILICLFLWILRKTKVWKQQSRPAAGQVPSEQVIPAEDDVAYSVVHFATKQEELVYSNINPTQSKRHKKRKEEEMVEYASVNCGRTRTAARTESAQQDSVEDPAALYSSVNKPGRNIRETPSGL
ncbi:sialoadhesin-like isoform X1 [Poeciliopsis prolifica]|uniref:sialoadhesin-like isoform X1 n=1 Tax=Poeciliopsis prolifica TaxID=188132 RepID=UPI002413A5DD|nr:sialoadhesin-like isoform X1 [Poeciliopsis prolifica]